MKVASACTSKDVRDIRSAGSAARRERIGWPRPTPCVPAQRPLSASPRVVVKRWATPPRLGHSAARPCLPVARGKGSLEARRRGSDLHLTPGEIRRLKERAALDLRSVGSLVAWLVTQEVARNRSRRARARAVHGTSARDRRVPFSEALTLPPRVHSKLKARAAAELRSVSGYANRVVVEALASR